MSGVRKPHRDPIWVPCEGSNCPVHFPQYGFGICSMCGQQVVQLKGNALHHERKDILAMLDRGDFDA